mmetsp:Transcript_1533/g.4628  ORF Transcript_1533/g.4628 Transcript_1533/m.4628 type:complete len:225 (+) Transcript_1533:256-930(+)
MLCGVDFPSNLLRSRTCSLAIRSFIVAALAVESFAKASRLGVVCRGSCHHNDVYRDIATHLATALPGIWTYLWPLSWLAFELHIPRGRCAPQPQHRPLLLARADSQLVGESGLPTGAADDAHPRGQRRLAEVPGLVPLPPHPDLRPQLRPVDVADPLLEAQPEHAAPQRLGGLPLRVLGLLLPGRRGAGPGWPRLRPSRAQVAARPALGRVTGHGSPAVPLRAL